MSRSICKTGAKDLVRLGLTRSFVRSELQLEHISQYKESLQTDKSLDPAIMTKMLDEKITCAEKFFESYKDRCLIESKVNYWTTAGRIYSLSPTYTNKAIECLTKVVKLDPNRFPVWNQLGECYWSKHDRGLAIQCFQNALDQARNPVSLRNLSIIKRKAPASNLQHRKQNCEEGIQLAKEAVGLDLRDGTSWTILGNAYISAYFTIKRDSLYAFKAISAYKQAEKTDEGLKNCDLHHNKYIALKFVECYDEALLAITKALEISPRWELARLSKASLVKYLTDIHVFNATNGRLKPKKVSSLRKDITRADLGPYANNLSYTPSVFSNLKVGENPKLVICGRVTWNLQVDGSFPFTFGLIDSEGGAMVITLYNLAEQKGFIIGDSVAIPDPTVSKVDFSYGDKEFSFLKVRVDVPTSVIVNGRPIPAAYNCVINFHSIDF